METHMKFRQLTCSKHLILALALCSYLKGKLCTIHQILNPNLETTWELRWTRITFKKSNCSFQKRKHRGFYKKTNITKISKSNFIYLIWHKTYKNSFVPFLNFSTTSKGKKGILIHLMSCTASDMWKEAPERSTKKSKCMKNTYSERLTVLY